MNRIHTELKKLPMHFKWENPCRIRHQIEKIKSVGQGHIFDEPKRNQIQSEFENPPCILNGKKPYRIRLQIEKNKVLDQKNELE